MRCGFDPSVRKIPWRQKWQPTPVFLPGESHGQRSLAGYSPWGCKESDMTEWLPLSLSHSQSLQCTHEAEVDVFLEFPCFLYDPMNVANLLSGSSDFFKPSLYIWKFLVHILLKPNLENFQRYLASMWNECNCAIVWTFFALHFFGIEMKTDFFQSYGWKRLKS